MKKIELLAPAKNLETGKAAINAGADAVYIGGPKFGARAKVGNSTEDIAALAEYCHKYYAKLYVTLNTLIYESEISEAEELIQNLYSADIDALIVQDLGILKMKRPPELPLFASTQTNNYLLDRIKFIDSLGFSRIILARELSLDQIKEISNSTSCELESFVFGALCVSLSGQCYMSAAAIGRSANRGECSQMCRHSYDLIDESGKLIAKDKFLLSLKDLNLESRLADLLAAGITSFKIEGRLKDIDYVTNVVAYFRQKLDAIFANSAGKYSRSSSGKSEYAFIPDLARTFNRGFTEYCIDGKNDKLSNIDSPKSVGKFIGTAKSSFGNKLEINTTETISAGDGLCYYQNGELLGFRVNSVENKILHLISHVNLQAGTKLFRNNDIAFEKLLASDKAARRTLEAKISCAETPDGITLTATDEDGNSAAITLQIEKSLAENAEKSVETIEKQLKKSGGTIFRITEVTNIPPYFIKISLLNDARRQLLDNLENERENHRSASKADTPGTSATSSQPVRYVKSNFPQMYNISNSLARQVYAEKMPEVAAASAPEITGDFRNIPLMTTRYCILREMGMCLKMRPANSENQSRVDTSALYLQDKSHTYRLEFDCKNCLTKIYLKI